MGSIQENEPLVSVRGLRTHFAKTGGLAEQLLGRPNEAVRAVDGVDLEIRRGEVLGLVGESGSGKTTLGKTILRLVPATAGDIAFEGTNVTKLRGRRLGSLRRRAQMVHQDPHASLSPRLRVATQLTEPYRIHNVPETGRRAVAELLDMVGLPEDLAGTYPHELSGGQARRVGIARALALEPALLVADEPTAGLDVSAAGGILNLLRDLADQLDLTCLVVSHDLNVVDYLTDRVAVMYLGKIFEAGPTEQIFESPAHPYTRALLSSAPEATPRHRGNRPEDILAGEIPSPKHPPTACRFHPRCPFADDRSRTTEPTLEEVANDHVVACHHWKSIREESLTGTDGSPAA